MGFRISVYICGAAIWIASSFVVQSVVDAGVSPFLVTYICNSLFVIYIPLVEVGRFLEDKYGSVLFWRKPSLLELAEEVIFLEESRAGGQADNLSSHVPQEGNLDNHTGVVTLRHDAPVEDAKVGLDAKGRWTRSRVAKVSLFICPFWFFAQLTFNLSLKYTTVTILTYLQKLVQERSNALSNLKREISDQLGRRSPNRCGILTISLLLLLVLGP